MGRTRRKGFVKGKPMLEKLVNIHKQCCACNSGIAKFGVDDNAISHASVLYTSNCHSLCIN